MKNYIMMLLIAILMTSCKENTPTPSNTENASASNASNTTPAPAAPDTKPEATETTETKTPAPTTSQATTSAPERIKLAKGAYDTDVKFTLKGGETKKYIAFVSKGFMTCTMPESELGANITVKVNGKVRDLAEEGPCSEHAKTAGDQTIEFTNNGSVEMPIAVNVSFNEHG